VTPHQRLTVIIALISWRLVERPALRWKARLSGRAPTAAAAVH
jgi:peptidoglycan/LPS O-acetylase OafA/YrhL